MAMLNNQMVSCKDILQVVGFLGGSSLQLLRVFKGKETTYFQRISLKARGYNDQGQDVHSDFWFDPQDLTTWLSWLNYIPV